MIVFFTLKQHAQLLISLFCFHIHLCPKLIPVVLVMNFQGIKTFELSFNTKLFDFVAFVRNKRKQEKDEALHDRGKYQKLNEHNIMKQHELKPYQTEQCKFSVDKTIKINSICVLNLLSQTYVASKEQYTQCIVQSMVIQF